MTEKPPLLKPLSPQDWESIIDDFNYGGYRREKLNSLYPIPSLVQLALSSLLKKDFPFKIPLLLFLEEFSDTLFLISDTNLLLERLIDTLRSIVQAPIDGVNITFLLKEQAMVSTTSIFISIDAINRFGVKYTENLVELLLTVINRPNHGLDRQTRAVTCECLRELERFYPCLLADIVAHLWSLCQSERTHASQSYILLFTMVVYNIVNEKLNVSILNTSVQMVPFSVPWFVLGTGSKDIVSGFNSKELRRAMAFLLEWPHVMTPYAMMEFIGMIMPMAVALELQASMLKVQFFGMIYSFNPVLCHVVLTICLNFFSAFDGQERDIVQRLMLVSRETQHFLIFRLLAIHWSLGLLNKLTLSGEFGKKKPIVDMGLKFHLAVFDPLALKALKLDLIAYCAVSRDLLKLKGVPDGEESIVKLFEDSLVSLSSFKWLPSWSTETVVAFRTFHKFLIGTSSHCNDDPTTTQNLLESKIFRTLQTMLVDLTLEFRNLVPVIVAFIDRLLSCKKHRWLGERLLQTVDKHLLHMVKIDYGLVSYFPIFDRIAENDTIPPRRLIDLLTKFLTFLVKKHVPYTRLKSWSHGSKVLSICRTMLMHQHSSRLFLPLSHLLAFVCLYFPDLDVRDHARIYLRMLVCVPGTKLRGILNLGEQLLGIPSSHASSFFNVQSPRHFQVPKRSNNVSSYIYIERVIPLRVKQSWSLSLSLFTFGVGSQNSSHLESVTEPRVFEKELDTDIQNSRQNERIDKPSEPLRVTDTKVSEIIGILRRHFSCIPDYRHMHGLKVRISCTLRFQSEPFNRIWGGGSPASRLDCVDTLPAIYATVLKFSSAAPYGSIPSSHIPFLLGEPSRNDDLSGQTVSMDIVSVENQNCSDEEKSFRVLVSIDLEPREPTPGVVDVSIETNTENGQIIQSQLQSVTVGIEDMFLKAIIPPEIPIDLIPEYYSDLFSTLWEACGSSTATGGEIFPLKGGKGVAAISGTQSVKLLEVPADSLIQATERYLAPFVVSVIGEVLVNVVKGGEIIKDVIWKDMAADFSLSTSPDLERRPLCLTYREHQDEDERHINFRERNMGSFHILVFLPPRFHLLLQMEVSNVSTLVRIRTDHWPCLAYIDEYLEALFVA